MKPTHQILQTIAHLSPRERAAAIAHYVYMKTAEGVGWGTRVPPDWDQLTTEAKDFNMASADTRVKEGELYRAWCDALGELREGGESPGP